MSEPEQPQPPFPLHPTDVPPRIRSMREFLAHGEVWLVGECPDDPETGRPIELLFVPADGPVGACPRRLFSPVALTMLTSRQLVALLERAR